MSDICKVCGCTDDNACITEEGPCHWVMRGLCSACYIELPAGENCFKGDVGLIIPKECRCCAFLKEVAVSTDILKSGEGYTCIKGRFDHQGIPQWYAWRGLSRPNKAVARAQKKCPFWEVHPRYKAQK